MHKFYRYTLIIFLLMNSILYSQQNWKLSAQIRHRSELDNKDFNGDTNPLSLNYLRTRIALKFTPSDDVEGYFQIQDSRMFGEETSTLTDGSADNLDLHQAYFLIKDIFDFPLDLKIGRMEVVYGPQRLIGAVGWHNIGRSFDGGILKYHTEKLNIDFFSFKEFEGNAPANTNDRILFGAYADVNLSKKYETHAFLIWQREKPLDNLDRYTTGFYAKGDHGKFYHTTEFAYQGGKFSSMDVSAIMAAVKFGYILKQSVSSPDISIGVDYLSGDENTADNKYKVFNTLYATNHKYYGYMDYFLDIPSHTYSIGLFDYNAQIALKLFDKNVTKIKFHSFNSTENYTLINGNTANDFGSEIDLTLSYKYNENVSFVGGASYFSPGKIFKETKGSDGSTWLYMMSTVNL